MRARMVLASNTMPPAASTCAKRTKGLKMTWMGELGGGTEISCSVGAGVLIHQLHLVALILIALTLIALTLRAGKTRRTFAAVPFPHCLSRRDTFKVGTHALSGYWHNSQFPSPARAR